MSSTVILPMTDVHIHGQSRNGQHICTNLIRITKAFLRAAGEIHWGLTSPQGRCLL